MLLTFKNDVYQKFFGKHVFPTIFLPQKMFRSLHEKTSGWCCPLFLGWWMALNWCCFVAHGETHDSHGKKQLIWLHYTSWLVNYLQEIAGSLFHVMNQANRFCFFLVAHMHFRPLLQIFPTTMLSSTTSPTTHSQPCPIKGSTALIPTNCSIAVSTAATPGGSMALAKKTWGWRPKATASNKSTNSRVGPVGSHVFEQKNLGEFKGHVGF